MEEDSAKILDVKLNEVQGYDIEDPFNGNRLEVVVCRRGDHRYGAMVLWRVNGLDCGPQRIYCTPKLRYPFGRTDDGGERVYHFPKFVQAALWEKLDGTNVLQYGYRDAAGTLFTSYKTRLMPVIQESRFGNFLTMWREILKARPEIAGRDVSEHSYSYEMYGYRNHHLVRYDVPLDARLLFVVGQRNAEVLPPTPYGVPPEYKCNTGDDLVSVYEAMRQKAQDASEKKTEDEEEVVYGSEGYVMYVLTTEGRWEMFKAKPEMVEASHWASNSIPESIILPTVRNAFEQGEVTEALVHQMLLEEFTREQVGKSEFRVRRCIAKVKENLALKAKVLEVFHSLGLRWSRATKGEVMRGISKEIDRSKMRRAFSTLRGEFGEPI